ncbi:hypothetical protein DLH72_01735 [Candidatus Gracilibacteria bacterium]|nr:MAG: hypothetical protein DLH72_01735 [Candidatus Gracilibacteria bacterium]
MIDLQKNLELNNIYTNVGNSFSKSILLFNFLKKENFLFIVDSDKQILNYKKIFGFLKINIFEMKKFSDFSDFYFNKIGKYFVSKDFFNLEIDKKFVERNTFEVKVGDRIDTFSLTKKLNELEIKFSDYEEKGFFNIKGEIFSYFTNSGEILKISFWGDEIDEILLGDKKIEKFTFGLNKDFSDFCSSVNNFLIDFSLESRNLFVLDNVDFYSFYDEIIGKLSNFISFSNLGQNSINLGIEDLYLSNLDDFKNILEEKKSKKYIFTKNLNTIKNFLDLNNIENIEVIKTELNNLKSFKTEKVFVFADDIISKIFVKRRVKKSFSENLDLLMQIKPGDYIVHIDHGVGIFSEIVTKEIPDQNGKILKKEYITIEYKNNDKLFVPIMEVSRVSKYVGSENPKLTSLSTKDWEKKLAKVSADVEQIAGELLEIYAKRNLQKGFAFASKKADENEFFKSFPYVYTEDQHLAIEDIFADMEKDIPMDRLLCGDVGFGKTEVAFASIFKCLINEKQAALISPLVVLAYEHFEKARERFANFPFNIEVITRFEKSSVIKSTLEKLKTGKIDLIVGTHRILSEDVEFKNLGLLVIDEEHKFGVKDKEKIKALKGNIDILSMSATPIPRSLNMALNGLRQVSMLTTPPVGKQEIQTIISDFNDGLIFDACKREFERGGQVFFIHNRVETILNLQSHLEKLLPGKKILVAHGQLKGDTLEKRILEFKKKQYDILLATTVIENGIDFSNVNTIFINDSINFGISQIHQLRGRVGRGQEKGYCYLLFNKDKIKEDAAKRLKTIVDYSHLGAGFELAVKDLEIRGGGDILGIRQSGSSSEVGLNLFLEMLEDKIVELKNIGLEEVIDEREKRISTIIDLNIDAYIEDDLFSGELDKINFYREIESVRTLYELENMKKDFYNLNENISNSTKNFFDLLDLKIKGFNYKISSIKKLGINYQIDFMEESNLEDIKEFLKLDKEVKFSFVNDKKLRSPIKNFENTENFVKYLLGIFNSPFNPLHGGGSSSIEQGEKKKKIKLKK